MSFPLKLRNIQLLGSMNELRKHWKENGTPFYFNMKYDGDCIAFSQKDCVLLDKVGYSASSTCLDVLVDIQYILRCLCRCSDVILVQSIKYELWQIVSHIKDLYLSKCV